MAYSKKELRQAYIARLQQLDLNTRLYEERKLASLLYDQPEWTGAKTIAVTLSQSFEIDTAPIILHARHKGQQIVIPRTLPHRQMEFVELNEDTDFDETSFGILEPHDGKVYSPDEIDLMVVPGVAFTASGNRLGFGGGYLIAKLVVKAFSAVPRRKANKFFTVGQAFGAGANAFLHGAQDGQKFMGVFMLVLFYNNLVEKTGGGFVIPLWVMVLCSITMGIGTSVGGMRIIKSVGMDMVKLERYQGFTADLSTAICLFLASAFGIPVSTTHTKTTAIMGVGASKRISSVDWRIVKEMLIAWILTFPGCGLIAYVMSKLFIAIF